MEVLKNNPYISGWKNHDETVPIEELEEHWKKQCDGFDLAVNLTGTVENSLLFAYPQPEWFWTMKKRRDFVNGGNYLISQIKRAGYDINGKFPLPEVYFSKNEEKKVRSWRRKHRNKFKIVWALSGSSIHKAYRYFEQVARAFLARHKDAVLFTVGDYVCKLLTFKHPRVYNTMFWEMPIRESMLITKYADMVIGPETGMLITSAAFDTPKIVLLSHSSPEMLTKGWKNAYPLQAPCWCSPCHLLHKYKYIWRHVCHINDDAGFDNPMCCEHGPADVLEKMEEIYERSKEKIH
jgi:ADP-heptose:LPS heptosyltransferase